MTTSEDNQYDVDRMYTSATGLPQLDYAASLLVNVSITKQHFPNETSILYRLANEPR